MDIKFCLALVLVLVWILWRLYKHQVRFNEIEKQIQYLFKKLDDFVKKHV